MQGSITTLQGTSTRVFFFLSFFSVATFQIQCVNFLQQQMTTTAISGNGDNKHIRTYVFVHREREKLVCIVEVSIKKKYSKK